MCPTGRYPPGLDAGKPRLERHWISISTSRHPRRLAAVRDPTIQSDRTIIDERWSARLNGTELPGTRLVVEPFPMPYPDQLRASEQHRAWSVPLAALRSGPNVLSLTRLEDEGEVPLWFIDQALT
jgi:hypothetical protein